jgi:hypothetical protein
MKRTYTLTLAAMMLTLAVGSADAKKPGSGGGGAVPTNYGCSTLAAGTVVNSSDGLTQKRLLMATSACYVCNTATRVCVIQSPSSYVGWTFLY